MHEKSADRRPSTFSACYFGTSSTITSGFEWLKRLERTVWKVNWTGPTMQIWTAYSLSKYLILKPLSSMTRKSYTRGELKENERMWNSINTYTSDFSSSANFQTSRFVKPAVIGWARRNKPITEPVKINLVPFLLLSLLLSVGRK